jgi:hypothetical protein
MFFRRAFGKNHNNSGNHDYSQETFDEMSANQFQSPPSPHIYINSNSNHNLKQSSRHTKMHNNVNSNRRGSFGEKEKQLKSTAINCGGGLR